MVLYIVGLGMWDEKDVTVSGLEAIRKSERVILEMYTSVLLCDSSRLEKFYGKEIEVADRETVEQGIEPILRDAAERDVSFLVVGDPFGATTHTDLVLRAAQLGVPTVVIHNASIMNAIGCCGLQLYRFGQTVSMVFFTDDWKPESFYERIEENLNMGLHTLCLVDIKVKEQTIQNMMLGNKVFEPPRFMTVNTCIEQMLEVEKKLRRNVCAKDSICVGLARVGSEEQHIACGTMEELAVHDFGEPLHSVVIPARSLHELEIEFLRQYTLPGSAALASFKAADS